MRNNRTLALGAALLALNAVATHAQSMRAQCAAGTALWVQQCDALTDVAATLPARFAVAAVGGNPVAGTASTLGMRMPGSPRWSIALRSTVARASLPPVPDGGADTPTLWSVNADAAVGLFNGVNLLPTIGGFGSIDVLASIGVVSAPDDFDRT